MRNHLIKTLAAGCGIFLAAASYGMAADYDHTVEAKNMTFSWKIDGDKLAAKLTAETEGWVGVGFNPSQKMKDANFILGYVKDGKVTIVDDYGNTSTGHKDDVDLSGTSDVTVVGGTEEEDVTTIEFIIPLTSGDKTDVNIDVNGDTTVLLAYGADRDSFRTKHKYRTQMTINLSTGAVK
jgi:hypothetical protein